MLPHPDPVHPIVPSSRDKGELSPSPGPDSGTPGARLDIATLTVTPPTSQQPQRFWAATGYPEAGEGSVYFYAAPLEDERNTGERGAGSERAKTEAERRARTTLRRYCVANKLDRLVTLTYRPDTLPDDWSDCWKDIERFRRRLFKVLGESVALACVIERGSQSDRLHVHCAVGQYIQKSDLEQAWGLGFVDIRKVKVSGVGKRERGRRAAAYLSKYLGKGSADRDFNGKRYSVTRHFQARKVRTRVLGPTDGLEALLELLGGFVVSSWSSIGVEGWEGPPVYVFQMSDP